MFRIETKRLLLRDFIPADTDGYVALSADAKYQRFYTELDCSTARAVQLVELFIQQARVRPRTVYQLAITLKGNDSIIGTCGLRVEPYQQASLGCGLAREKQVSGYAQESMHALVEFGFKHLNLHRVYMQTLSENAAAIALGKKSGLRCEAEFIDNQYFKSQWWNTSIMAMLKSEWQEQKQNRTDSIGL
ncbi:GNAT family N-acetyltransferase ['Osedax' symbiont bacterium Rs2_46_30_T18]|nr:GNAT family N-acetyltransferase ['Osedax' symbiont bacterium Rs2_46_30_T18]